jgi:hypothetical protein
MLRHVRVNGIEATLTLTLAITMWSLLFFVQYLSTVSIYRLVSVRGTLWMLGVGLATVDLIKRNGKEVVEWYSKSHCACELNMLSIVSLRLVGTVCVYVLPPRRKSRLFIIPSNTISIKRSPCHATRPHTLPN